MNPRTQNSIIIAALVTVVGLSWLLCWLLTPQAPNMSTIVSVNTTINAQNVVIVDSSIGNYTLTDKAIASTITKTPVISYELDLLQLYNYEHGQEFLGNDDVRVTTVPSKGRPARVIVFDTSRDDLNPDDSDKRSSLGKMLTVNTHTNPRAADSGEMTFNFTSKTFFSRIKFLDVDHGSAKLFAYDEAGNLIKTIKMAHGENGQVQTMWINLTVSKVVIKVNDSFALLPYFYGDSKAKGACRGCRVPRKSI